MSENELSRPVRIDTIGTGPRTIAVAAEAPERAALARRFGLAALDRLEADVTVARAQEELVARGSIRAAFVQSCVVTGEPVPGRIDEPFAVIFRPDSDGHAPDEEVELGGDELDVCFYEGAAVDVGEAVAQTLGLALDPYPRAPGSEAALREAGVKDESEAGPFGALAALKDKLG